jgi:calcineurin-like phosphoesterase family protein
VNTWFTSDEHYGHKNIVEYCGRPYADVREMNERLIRNHNEVVRPDDDVWHLGDFAFRPDDNAPEILPRLNGTHRLVAGNHDKCHPCHKKHEKSAEQYRRWGFAEVVHAVESIRGFRACHLPYGDLRYPGWAPTDCGGWLLHGHVHTRWKVRGRMINVGVDAWNYAPVHLDELLAIRMAA